MTMLEQLPMLSTMSPEYQADWHGLNRAALAQSPVAQGIFGPKAELAEGLTLMSQRWPQIERTTTLGSGDRGPIGIDANWFVRAPRVA